MIIRIMGEGQWSVEEAVLADFNAFDDAVSQALESNDQAALTAALAALHEQVRERGVPVADDVLADSDLILPPADATIDQVRSFLDEIGSVDGLIPG